VKTVSEEACVKTWIGMVHLKEDRLPDLKKWREEFRVSVGDLFALHGVEATGRPPHRAER
jgi:predicted transcriptional regulator